MLPRSAAEQENIVNQRCKQNAFTLIQMNQRFP